jgi:hypothetical protein
MTTVDYGNLLSFGEVGRLLPSKPNPSTLWRWHVHGCYGIRLQTVLIGGRRFVERAQLDDFVDRVTTARERNTAPDSVAARTPETESALAAAGLSEPKRRGRPRKAKASVTR